MGRERPSVRVHPYPKDAVRQYLNAQASRAGLQFQTTGGGLTCRKRSERLHGRQVIPERGRPKIQKLWTNGHESLPAPGGTRPQTNTSR